MRRHAVVLLAFLLVACNQKSPAPPIVTGPGWSTFYSPGMPPQLAGGDAAFGQRSYCPISIL
jgi:hypothetical protein